MKTLFGYFLGLILLSIYILFVTRLGQALFPMHVALEFAYYAIAGIGWIYPAMGIIRWWVKPKEPKK